MGGRREVGGGGREVGGLDAEGVLGYGTGLTVCFEMLVGCFSRR